MNELALFAGAGGGLLATRWLLGWQTVCYVEIGKYPVKVLEARIRDEYLDDAPIWDDVRTFDGEPWRGCVDIVTAGFPCQPFSTAGKQQGADDNRNMWPATIRIIRETQPRWVLLENVPGLLSAVDNTAAQSIRYFGTILADLAQSGYDARWRVLSAAEVGAPHKRDRVWVMAYSKLTGDRGKEQCCQADGEDTEGSTGRTGGSGCGSREGDVAYTNSWGLKERSQFDSQTKDDPADGDTQGRYTGRRGDEVADTHYQRLAQRESRRGDTQPKQSPTIGAGRQGGEWWLSEPDVGRVANRVANRVDRLKAIGNGQVPLVAATVWRLLGG